MRFETLFICAFAGSIVAAQSTPISNNDGVGENYEELDYLKGDEDLNNAARGIQNEKKPLQHTIAGDGDDESPAAYENLGYIQDEEVENIEAQDPTDLSSPTTPRSPEPTITGAQNAAVGENISHPIPAYTEGIAKRHVEDADDFYHDKPGCKPHPQGPSKGMHMRIFENDNCNLGSKKMQEDHWDEMTYNTNHKMDLFDVRSIWLGRDLVEGEQLDLMTYEGPGDATSRDGPGCSKWIGSIKGPTAAKKNYCYPVYSDPAFKALVAKCWRFIDWHYCTESPR